MTRRRVRRPRHSKPNLPLTLLIIVLMALAYVVQKSWPDEAQEIKAKVLEYTGLNGPAPMSEADFMCTVAKVNDGDTLRCADGTRVRLHAVAARESNETCSPGHPCPSASAAAATSALTRMVAGQTLACMETGTSYNRVTAICWTPQGVEVNCAMIKSGTTVVWDRFNRETPICRR